MSKQEAMEKVAAMMRQKRLTDADKFIKTFPLFQDQIPKPVKLSIHKDLNRIRRKEGYDFGAQHILLALEAILQQDDYKKQITKGVVRYDLHNQKVK